MTDTVPFTHFHARLKCLRNEGWDAVQEAAFRFAFPRFFEGEQPNPDSVRKSDAFHAIADGVERPFRYRRFSGGACLPRSRYYSVCETDSGQDSQTLAQELMAYAEWSGKSQIFALDLDDPHQDGTWDDFAAIWGVSCPTHQIALVFQWDTPVPPPELKFLPLHKLSPGVQWCPVLYEETLSKPSLPRTIDLRLPETQQWLAANIFSGLPNVLYTAGGTCYRGLPRGDGTDRPWPADRPFVTRMGLDCFSYPPRHDWDGQVQRITPDFHGLLPLLMYPGPGGSPLTEAIGHWVRSLGADALIYPSARANVRCMIESGRLTQSWGWNLVDYRGAEPVKERAVIIQEPHSWIGMWGQIGVNDPQGRLAGTFIVDGNVEAHRQFVGRHLLS